MCFMDLEKPYDRVNREVLCQVMRKYDVSCKLLNGRLCILIVQPS